MTILFAHNSLDRQFWLGSAGQFFRSPVGSLTLLLWACSQLGPGQPKGPRLTRFIFINRLTQACSNRLLRQANLDFFLTVVAAQQVRASPNDKMLLNLLLASGYLIVSH